MIQFIKDLLTSPGKLQQLQAKYDEEVEVHNLTSQKLIQCSKDKKALRKAWKDQHDEVLESFRALEKQTKFFVELWKSEVNVPRLSDLTKKHTTVNPRKIPLIMRYAREIADLEYYAFTLSTWEKILERTHKEVREDLPKWIKEVSDCDNFADATNKAIRAAMIRDGRRKQAAIGWARSSGHAYNFFITNLQKVYIYEPQTGEIKGELGQTAGSWDTTKIYILG